MHSKRPSQCSRCSSPILRKNGTTNAQKQRWRCVVCGYSFLRTRPDQRERQPRIWFEKWLDGYTLKQLHEVSGFSVRTLHRLLLRELAKPVPAPSGLETVTHLLFDGKFLFGRKYCLLTILDATTNRPVAGMVVAGETRRCITPWLQELKAQGLRPTAVTTDGRQAGIYAFTEAWPDIVVQRCLFHIRLQVESWCRARPKYPAAHDLKQLCGRLCSIKTASQAESFASAYWQLRQQHQETLATLDASHPVEGDILQAYRLVRNALSFCFRYLDDLAIASTTSPLEGYFKQIQDVRGFRHAGLTEKHLVQFLAWKIHYDSKKKHT